MFDSASPDVVVGVTDVAAPYVVVTVVVAVFVVTAVVVTVVAAFHVLVVTVVVASPTIPDVTSLAVVVASPAVVVVVDFEDTDGGRIKRMREWLKLTNVRTWPSHF